MAPEYLAQGQLTEKVDVYGYGVLILEIVSGVQNNKFRTDDPLTTLVTAVISHTLGFEYICSMFSHCIGLPSSYIFCLLQTWKHFQLNTMSEIIDKSMEIEDMEEVTRVIQVGLLCTQVSPTSRPTMTETIQKLKQKDVSLPIPSKPPFAEENLTVPPTLLASTRKPAGDASDICMPCHQSDTKPR